MGSKVELDVMKLNALDLPENYKEIFSNQIAIISDELTRQFVQRCLDTAPHYFWYAKASMTGKYHPEFALVNADYPTIEGGLVRHTKAVVYFVKEFIECYKLEKQLDAMIAAAILHDICKYGINISWDAHKIHNYISAEHVWVTEGLDDEQKKVICNIIAHHMGRWNNLENVKAEWLEQKAFRWSWHCLHMADMAASRVKIDLKGIW